MFYYAHTICCFKSILLYNFKLIILITLSLFVNCNLLYKSLHKYLYKKSKLRRKFFHLNFDINTFILLLRIFIWLIYEHLSERTILINSTFNILFKISLTGEKFLEAVIFPQLRDHIIVNITINKSLCEPIHFFKFRQRFNIW